MAGSLHRARGWGRVWSTRAVFFGRSGDTHRSRVLRVVPVSRVWNISCSGPEGVAWWEYRLNYSSPRFVWPLCLASGCGIRYGGNGFKFAYADWSSLCCLKLWQRWDFKLVRRLNERSGSGVHLFGVFAAIVSVGVQEKRPSIPPNRYWARLSVFSWKTREPGCRM